MNNSDNIEKVIRNGLVAVVYSTGYGYGWSTLNNNNVQMIFHPKIVEMVEKGLKSEISQQWAESILGTSPIYVDGAPGLEIAWLPEGTEFFIHVYDGDESIRLINDVKIIA